MKSKTLCHILLFLVIDSAINFYIFLTTSTFLTYQWFINVNSETIKYYYDTNSVLFFSFIAATILTAILYKPLLTSKPLKRIWEKIYVPCPK